MVSKRKANKINDTAIIPTSDIVTRDDGLAQVIPFKTASAERLEKKINKTRKRIAMHQKPIETTPFPEMARQQILSKSIMGKQAALTKKMAEEAVAKQKEDSMLAREQVHLDAIRQIAPNIVNQLVKGLAEANSRSKSEKVLDMGPIDFEPRQKKVKRVDGPVIEDLGLTDERKGDILNFIIQKIHIDGKMPSDKLILEHLRQKTGNKRAYNGSKKMIADVRSEFKTELDSEKQAFTFKHNPSSSVVVEDVTPQENSQPSEHDDSIYTGEGLGLKGKGAGFFSNLLKKGAKALVAKIADDPIGSIKTAIDTGKQAIEIGKQLREAYAQKTNQNPSEGGHMRIKKSHLNKLKKHYTKLHGAGWFDSFLTGFTAPLKVLGAVGDLID
jgi:hypothetical protein